jgi:hypothetical protein
VEYRPLIFTTTGTNTWEGHIYPRHPSAWMDSYFHAEKPYLKVAEKMGISEFVVETEMHAMNRNPLWASMLKRVGKVYHGTVSYTSWDGDYFPKDRHLLPVRRLGMDMYKRSKLKSNATARQVTKMWASWFKRMPVGVLHRTAIDETSIQARSGAYSNPAYTYLPGKENNKVQANWFHAACKTVHDFGLRGVYFWKVDLTDYPDHPATSLSTFEGRPSAKVISDYCPRVLH